MVPDRRWPCCRAPEAGAETEKGAHAVRILHVVPTRPFGGAQRMALSLAGQQCRNGHDARVLMLRCDDETRSRAGRYGCDVQAVPGPGLLATVRATEEALRAFRGEVVHLHMPPPWMAELIDARRDRLNVLHLHALPPVASLSSLRAVLTAPLIKRLAHRVDRLIAVSNWARDAWQREYPTLKTPISVVYNAVPVEPIVREVRSGATFSIGIACRLQTGCGIEEFLEFGQLLVGRRPNVRLVIAGDGPNRGQFEADAIRRGLGDCIRFLGFVEHIEAFWQELDLAVYTGHAEPFGLRLIEPVAAGVPLIAYRNGTGSDEVIARLPGVIAVPYGAAAALVDAAETLMNDPELASRVSVQGMTDVRAHFSLQRMADEIMSSYVHA